LTFPEQLLIVHLYPHIQYMYVFKLFPKWQAGAPNLASMQNSMRGNISTYDHNMDTIVDMLEGNLMPSPATILASMVSITFIGLGPLPKDWLCSTFHVCWHAVWDALQWLQQTNAKYYGSIKIDASHIEDLPVDDVPIEI
ncbi:hypothetical protein EDD16DRAFT_1750555, partial [Pisolithus croceorrhizus]